MKQIWREERYGGKKFELILLSLSPSNLNHYYLIMAHVAITPFFLPFSAPNKTHETTSIMTAMSCHQNCSTVGKIVPSIVLVLHTSSPPAHATCNHSSHQLFTSSTVSQPCCGINTAFHFNSHYLRSEPLVWSRHGWNSSIQGMEVIHHGM